MQGLWREMPLAFFDLETTGLDTDNDRIVEVGIVTYRDGRLAERWGQLVNPGIPIPPGATDTHHITNEMVKDEPSFHEVKWEVYSRLRDKIMVGYNGLKFDQPMVESEFVRHGLTAPQQPVLDPMMWVIQLMPKRSYKQEMVAEQLGITVHEAHRAVADCEALAQITMRLADQLPPALGELLAQQDEWTAAFLKRKAEQKRRREEREAAKAEAEASKAEEENKNQEGLF